MAIVRDSPVAEMYDEELFTCTSAVVPIPFSHVLTHLCFSVHIYKTHLRLCRTTDI